MKAIFFLLLFICIIVGGALLKLMQGVIKPVVMSVLLTFVFYPLIKKMNRTLHIPWWCGTAIVYILFFGVFLGIGNILSASLKSIFASIPDYEAKFSDIHRAISESLRENKNSKFMLFLNFDEEQTLFENISSALNLSAALKKVALEFTGIIFTFTKSTFLVVLLSIFLIAEMKVTQMKIGSAFGEKYRGKVRTILKNTISETTRYISIKFVISLATGTIVAIICRAFSVDFAAVWGFFAFVMNFIPTFGSIISCAATSLFALIQFYPSPFPIIMVASLTIATNFIIGNIIEPRIEGNDLGLSPFVILVSLSLWGWLWGFLGLLLAIPLTVIVKIICENISFLHPLAIFLGQKPRAQDLPQENS